METHWPNGRASDYGYGKFSCYPYEYMIMATTYLYHSYIPVHYLGPNLFVSTSKRVHTVLTRERRKCLRFGTLRSTETLRPPASLHVIARLVLQDAYWRCAPYASTVLGKFNAYA